MNTSKPQVTFVVGEDRRLCEIISRTEIEPLLRSLVKAGPAWAAVLDEERLPLCRLGDDRPFEQLVEIHHKLLVEGEPQGMLVIAFDPATCGAAEPLALLARDALQLTVTNNLKRMLTTEMHTSVVQESYDQLVETNRCLEESEKRYRELALQLEQKVEERTAELQKAYSRMLQQEKLAAVGSLAAGMAHEINNPNGFVRSNLTTLRKYVDRMKEMLNHYQLMITANTPLQQLHEETEQLRRTLKLDVIFLDTAALLEQSIEGTDRIARIVADLKAFSHVDERGDSDADLNMELKRVLAVLESQIPPETVIVQELQPLSLVGCNPGLLSQAFLNVIQNAIQSRSEGLHLKLSSECKDNEIVIRIADNGCGIAAANITRVFEPFFTTREVGCGTGMGLTVAREIVRGIGGSIEIDSLEGSGTTVTIRVPLGKNNDMRQKR
ncbi:MAG: ATP-binding protein [Desulfuromonadaceae bacterium]|nr:ATP-binding protein [Desulfuromonadaceae bacterium]MDD2848018.1 ATP-binding protein [Desulfuromonadaceae bacterium]MDD4131240.1 ATP-binding protein [Desulfuromonadaceae bacterium]